MFSSTGRRFDRYAFGLSPEGEAPGARDLTVVDAAHLIAFAESHSDHPSNGLALYKNHHWAMDRFLIAPGSKAGGRLPRASTAAAPRERPNSPRTPSLAGKHRDRRKGFMTHAGLARRGRAMLRLVLSRISASRMPRLQGGAANRAWRGHGGSLRPAVARDVGTVWLPCTPARLPRDLADECGTLVRQQCMVRIETAHSRDCRVMPHTAGQLLVLVFQVGAGPKTQPNTMKTLPPSMALAVITLLVAGGCASSTGYKKAGSTSSSLHDAAQSVAKTNAQVGPVLAALSDLVNNPAADATAQFQKFSTSVSQMESLADIVSGHATEMQAQGAAYFLKWDEELAKIRSEDMHTSSLDRREAVSARFDRVKASYAQARTDFAPFLSDLKDIRTVLGTDLTAGGVASVRGAANQANVDAVPLRESLRRLSMDFETLGVSLSAASPAN